jgi:transposase-like protein
MEEFLQAWVGVRNLEGKRMVVRNGYNPERTIQTGIGDVSVRMPKVRDRSQNGVVFHSSLIPPYIRKTRSLEELIPLLYLKGVSTGQMQEALAALVGGEARGFSPALVSRLKAKWTKE